jgi:hypothetical protein
MWVIREDGPDPDKNGITISPKFTDSFKITFATDCNLLAATR